MNTTTVATSQQNTDEFYDVDRIMARVLRQLCRETGVTREQIREALPDLTDTEFAALWAGTRTVYVNEAMALTYAFEPEPKDWIYPSAIFNALGAIREVTK